jgi:enamine deaminase RidA (YjgF/YER057c/UK114 family)
VLAYLWAALAEDSLLFVLAWIDPELWFRLLHDAAPEGLEIALLRRSAGQWAAFALAQAIVLWRWRRRPEFLAVAAGIRFSDLFTDVSYILAVPTLTRLGWIVLLPPPLLNLVGVVIMLAGYRRAARAAAPPARPDRALAQPLDSQANSGCPAPPRMGGYAGMQRRDVNAADAPAPAGQYTQAIEVTGATRTLYLSGQVGVAADGSIPETAEAQATLAWRNLQAQLRAAGMGVENLVKITTIVRDPSDVAAVRAGRSTVLGMHRPASTLIVGGLSNPAWKVEVEGIAVA